MDYERILNIEIIMSGVLAVIFMYLFYIIGLRFKFSWPYFGFAQPAGIFLFSLNEMLRIRRLSDRFKNVGGSEKQFILKFQKQGTLSLMLTIILLIYTD